MEDDAVERKDRYAVSSGEAGDVSLLLANILLWRSSSPSLSESRERRKLPNGCG